MGKNDEMDKNFEDGMDEMPFDEDEIVIIADENGEEREYVILAEVEEGGKDYAVLGARSDLEDENIDTVSYLIFEMVTQEDGEVELVEIEDEAIWNRLVEFVKSDLLSGGEDDEDLDGDEDFSDDEDGDEDTN